MNHNEMVARLAWMRDEMQGLIERNAPGPMREQHERAIANLKARIANTK